MNQSQLQTLINRYLNGQASAEEEVLLTRWLDVLAAKGAMPGEQLTHEEKELLRRKMFLEIRKRTGQLPRISPWRRWVAVAAVVAPLALALWFFTSRPVSPVKLLVLSTGIGEQKMVHLGDSSRIWLAPNSHLQYPETFGDNREVTLLSGEAYFDIAPQAQHPFSVKVDSLQVDVLGTAFNIRAYQHAQSLEVAVSNGKVRVMHGGEELGTLTESQQILVRKNTFAVSRHTIETGSIEAWKHNRLLFDRTPLPEALAQLENYYPVKFEAAGGLDLEISGSLNLRMKPQQIMEVLEELTSHRINFKEKEKGVYRVTITQ